MIIALISGVLLIISVAMFSFTFSYQGLNKAVIFTPIELFYEDITYTDEGAIFDRNVIKEKLQNYYQKMLPRYCKSYTDQYYFYNIEDESLCTTNNCGGVEITIDAILNLDYRYHRVMFYELTKGDSNG